MGDLASAFMDRFGDGQARLWIGTVDATPTGQTVNVTVNGTLMVGLRWLSSYRPAAGDVVSVAQVGADWLVLGKRAMNGAAEVAALLDTATVTAVDATAKTLSMTWSGSSFTGVRWLASYSPTVGDSIVVLRIAGQWLALGKPSTALGSVTPPTPTPVVPTTKSLYVQPSGAWQGSKSSSGSWVWSWSPNGVFIYQGKGQDFSFNPTLTWGGYDVFTPSIASQIPSGATIQTAKLSVTRLIMDNGPSLAAPVVYGHNRGSSPNPSGAPAFVSGYGPWKLGALTNGQTGSWDLPSSWLSALLAGTISGFGVYSTSGADFGEFMIAVTITYSI
jgi:hypothetical protein